MTADKRLQLPQSLSEAMRVAKEKRQAVLTRVRKQRKTAYRRNPRGNALLEEVASK
jgi:hypothetical protein